MLQEVQRVADVRCMALAGGTLTGRQGWTVVSTLALVLAVLVTEQVPAREAGASGAPPAVNASVTAPVLERDRPFARPQLAELSRSAAAPPPAVPVAAPAPPPPPPAPAPVKAAAPAKAAPTGGSLCSGAGWEQRRGEAALASLRAGAERTGFRVEFTGARKGYLGLTHLKQRRIEMFVRSCQAQSDALLGHVMAHELGHAYDTTHMTTAKRAAWMRARGIPASTPWYGCSGCTDFATPAGDYAEVYAQWARGATSNRSQLAGSPGPAELARLATEFFGA